MSLCPSQDHKQNFGHYLFLSFCLHLLIAGSTRSNHFLSVHLLAICLLLHTKKPHLQSHAFFNYSFISLLFFWLWEFQFVCYSDSDDLCLLCLLLFTILSRFSSLRFSVTNRYYSCNYSQYWLHIFPFTIFSHCLNLFCFIILENLLYVNEALHYIVYKVNANILITYPV